MTVVGDDIILNCRECFVQNGYGIRLRKNGGCYECPVDGAHKYVVEKGYLKRV
jgi:hypothetical protein